MSIIEIILSSNTALCVTIVPDLCQSAIQEIQRNDITHTNNKCNPCSAYLSLYEVDSIFELMDKFDFI